MSKEKTFRRSQYHQDPVGNALEERDTLKTPASIQTVEQPQAEMELITAGLQDTKENTSTITRNFIPISLIEAISGVPTLPGSLHPRNGGGGEPPFEMS